MDDQVPEEVKRERIERLVELVQHHARRRNEALVGTLQEVLVEGTSRTDAGLGPRPLARQQDGAVRAAGARGRARAGADRVRHLADAARHRARSPCRVGREQVVAIFGATASGKSAVGARAGRAARRRDRVGRRDAALRRACRSCRTSRPPPTCARVPHHLVGDLAADGRRRRRPLRRRPRTPPSTTSLARGRSPIVAGGTGPLPARGAGRPGAAAAAAGRPARPASAPTYDADPAAAYARLEAADPAAAARIHPQRPPPGGAGARAGRARRRRCIPAATTSCGRPTTATRPASSGSSSTGPSCTARIAGADGGDVRGRRGGGGARRARRGRAVRDRRAGARPGRDPRRHRRHERRRRPPAGGWSSARASTPGGRRSGCAGSPASSCVEPPRVGGTWDDAGGAPRPSRHRARPGVLRGVRRERHLREAGLRRGRHGRRVPLGPVHDRRDRLLDPAPADA